jgi:hypothetical protein
MTALIGLAGGSQPPALPEAELLATAGTLQSYAMAWKTWAEQEADSIAPMHSMRAAAAFRIAEQLADAAMHLRNVDHRTAALLQKGS